MTGNPCSFSLYRLGTSYLQTFRCSIRVQGHVLRLERSRTVTILLEDTAECGSKNTLAYVAASTCQHHRM